MKLTNPLNILLAFLLATVIKGDEDIVAVEGITCDPCTDCLTLNGYYFESGGVRTDDLIIIGEPSALVAEG